MMHLRLTIAVVLALSCGTAAAEATCSGSNLLARMAAEDPAAHARVAEAIGAIPYATGNFWRIERPGVAASFLFGTAHVTDVRATRFMERIEDALGGSRLLLVELAPDEQVPGVIGRAMMAHTRLPEGTALDDALTPGETAVLAKMAARHGLPWSMARRQRAGILAALLAVPTCAQLAMITKGAVLDGLIMAEAAARGIPVVGLETADEQFRAIGALDGRVQLRALVEFARLGAAFAEDVYETTLALYAAEMTAAITPLLVELAPQLPSAIAANEDAAGALIGPRNRTMFERAAPEVVKGGAFIAVGALHLSGADGLIALFHEAGFSVTRVGQGGE